MPINNILYDVNRKRIAGEMGKDATIPNALNFGKGAVAAAAGGGLVAAYLAEQQLKQQN